MISGPFDNVPLPPEPQDRRPYESDSTVHTLASVAPERITWLWPGRVPLGKLVVIDGDPSTGKSTLTLDLGARVSAGLTWPDGAPGPDPAGVLLLSAEDGLADTIVPRLTAAGADLANVHALTEVALVGPDGARQMAPPSLPRDIPVIEQQVRKHNVRLVVIDVLMAYLAGAVDSHRDQDVRAVLHRLAAMAEATGCTVVLIRHMNKAGGSNALYRGGGSIGIIGAARAAFLVARDPDDTDRRIFAVTKMNIGVEPPALAYRLQSDDSLDCSRVVWESDPVTLTAADLLRAPLESDERTERDDAADWLRDRLSDTGGTAPSKEIKDAARKAGHQVRTLQRARDQLGIIVESSGFPRTSYWSLPDAVVPPVPDTFRVAQLDPGGTTGDDLRKQNYVSGTTEGQFSSCATVPSSGDVAQLDAVPIQCPVESAETIAEPMTPAVASDEPERDLLASHLAPLRSVADAPTGRAKTTQCPVCNTATAMGLLGTAAGLACRRCVAGFRAQTRCVDCGHPRETGRGGRCNECRQAAARRSGAA